MPSFLNKTKPPGFPLQLQGPMAWDAEEYQDNPAAYVIMLSPQDIISIEEAVSHFKALNIARGFISRETFPLSTKLSKRLRSIADEVHAGRGFQILRGLEPDRYSEEDVIILYAGVASHVASHRAGFIDHIRYAKEDEANGENLRPTELPVSMDFHTDADAGTILSMFIHTKSREGGDQRLCSFWRVYNDLIEEHPDVVETLSRDWHWEKPNRATAAATNEVMQRAIIGHADGLLQINFGSSFVAGHAKYPRSAAAPPLQKDQRRALSILLAAAQRHSFQLRQKVGDIIFLNNLSIMHARDAFVDGVDSDSQRYLLRLWMMDTRTSWPIAKNLKYKPEGFYDYMPETQFLMTRTEWAATQRKQRLTRAGSAPSHD